MPHRMRSNAGNGRSKFAKSESKSTGEIRSRKHCQPHHPVVIEPVSTNSLPKTGISATRPGDFREILVKVADIGDPETIRIIAESPQFAGISR